MIPGIERENLQSQLTKSANRPCLTRHLSQKTKIVAPPLWGNGRREGVHNRRHPKLLRGRFHDGMQRKTNPRWAETLERRHDPQTQCQTPRKPNTTTPMDNGVARQLCDTQTISAKIKN